VYTVEGSIADAEAYQAKHPRRNWLCGTPLPHSGRGMQKPDSGFRDVLHRVKAASGKRNTVNTFRSGYD